MTTEIYVQTTEVLGSNVRHLAIWVVQNGVTTIIDARASGFLGNTGLDPLVPLGEIVLEKNVVQIPPSQTEIEISNLNQLTFSSQQDASDAASKILSYYDDMGTAFTDNGREFVRTGSGYDLLGPNSNAVGSSILNVIDVDYRDLNLYEDGDSSLEKYTPIDHTGHMGIMDSAGAETYTAYQYDGVYDTTVFIDKADTAGTDTLQIEDGAHVIIVSADGNAPVSDIEIILQGNPTGVVTYEARGWDDLAVLVDGEEVIYIEDGRSTASGVDLDLKVDLGNGTYSATKDLTALTSADFESTAMEEVTDWVQNTITWFGATFTAGWDPLVIDMDGDGVAGDFIGSTLINNNTASIEPVHFDLNADGYAEATEWHGDGFLVRDLNSNGRIDNGDEMFGNNTLDGFAHLATLDVNADGVINSSDAVWTDLQIWHDTNADAQTQSGELLTLASQNITAINLAATSTGNQVGLTHTGTVTTTSGTEEIGNYVFDVNTLNSRYAQNYDFDIRAAFLPNLRGYNELPDLNIALSLDNNESDPDSLMAIATDLASYSTTDLFENWSTVETKIKDLLYRWAGVDDVAIDSRGASITDARQLEFLEAFMGQNFVDQHWGGNPGIVQAQEFYGLWDSTIFPPLMTSILGQMQAGSLINGDFNFSETRLQNVTTLDQDILDDLEAAATALADTAARVDFWTGVGEFIMHSAGFSAGVNVNLSAAEQTKLKTAIEASDASLTWELNDHDPLNGTTSIEYKLFNLSGDTVTGDATVNDFNVDSTFGGTANDDFIEGLGGDDILAGAGGNDVIEGGDGNDELYGQAGYDILVGGAGNDTLIGGGGTSGDQLIGGDGNDILHAQNNTGGSQVLSRGGNGDDLYYAARGAWIDETDGNGDDTVELNELSGTLKFERYGDDLLMWFNNGTGGGNFVIRDHFNNGPAPVETIHFALDSANLDLTTFSDEVKTYGTEFDDVIHGIQTGASTVDEIFANDGDDEIYAGAGNDVLRGGNGDDILDGGDGDDILHGDAGVDTYIVSAGDDLVHANDDDILKFGSGITIADLSFSTRTMDDLYNVTITHPDGTTELRFQTLSANRLAELHFDNGSVVKMADIELITHGTEAPETITGIQYGASQNDTIYGFGGDDTIRSGNGDDVVYAGEGNDDVNASAGDDIIYGGAGDDILDGEFGSDIIYGEDGNDTIYAYRYGTEPGHLSTSHELYGGNGDDTLIGEKDSDVLDGGAGDDLLQGEAGDDIYHYSSGMDVVSESGGVDRVVFDASMHVDDLAFVRDGFKAKAVLNTGIDELHLDSRFSPFGSDYSFRIDTLEFQDGFELNWLNFDDNSSTLWSEGSSTGDANNNVMLGLSSDDSIDGLTGNDTLHGRAGNDILSGGDGDDQVHGGDGDDIVSGGEGDDRLWGGDGNDTVSYAAASAAITVSLLSGSTTGEGTDILSGFENIIGSAQGDSLTGDANANTLTGGLGNDTLDGGSGVDTASYAGASGGVTVDLTNNTSSGADGSDTLISIENAVGSAFADTIHGGAGANLLQGNAGRDSIQGWAGADTIEGGADDDLILGGDGDDVLHGGDGNEKSLWSGGVKLYDAGLFGGWGNDTLYGDGGNDVIYGEQGDDIIYGGDGDDILYGDDQFEDPDYVGGGKDIVYGGAGNDVISTGRDTDIAYGGDDNDVMFGGSEIDTLYGDAGNDILHGYQDGDTLEGGAGNDTIYGDDQFNTVGWADAGDDIIRGNAGVDTLMGGEGNDTIYGGTEGDTLYGHSGGDTINGDEGNDIIYGDFLGLSTAYDGNDTINGGAGADTINAGGGNDIVNGGDDADTVYGRDGDDTINGDGGNDILYGEAGSDTMRGGAGNDSLFGGNDNDVLFGDVGFDQLWGQAGVDTFGFEGETAFSTRDWVKDFASGEKIDIADVLSDNGYVDGVDTLSDWVSITTDAYHSYVSVDRDGTGGTYAMTQIALVENYNSLSTGDLVVV